MSSFLEPCVLVDPPSTLLSAQFSQWLPLAPAMEEPGKEEPVKEPSPIEEKPFWVTDPFWHTALVKQLKAWSQACHLPTKGTRATLLANLKAYIAQQTK